MYEITGSSDGFEAQNVPQVPRMIGHENTPLIGSPDIQPVTDITAPEIPENVAGPIGALATPAEVSVMPPGGNDPENVPSGTGAEEPVEAPDTGQAGQPPDLTPPPAENQETSPEPNPEANEIGQIFEAIEVFNRDHMREAGDAALGEASHGQGFDKSLFRETYNEKLREFGLEIDSDHPLDYMETRICDGARLIGRLGAIPVGAAPEAFMDGIQKLVKELPPRTQNAVMSTSFSDHVDLSQRDFKQIFLGNVLAGIAPDVLHFYGGTQGYLTSGESNAMHQTLAYAGGISDKMARLGVPEESLQEMRDMGRYSGEGRLTEWAVARELGFMTRVEEGKPFVAYWRKWDEPYPWDSSFEIIHRTHETTKPGDTFLPDLLDRLDAGIDRVVAEMEQQGNEAGLGTSSILIIEDDGTLKMSDLEVPPEYNVERQMKQLTQIAILRDAQGRLRRYK